jgi:putative membrane protein
MGEIKNTMKEALDTVAGMAGKMSAAATTSADSFVESAAIGDIYERTAAQIAMERASNFEVKAFAAKMLADHTTSTHQLEAGLEMNETRGVAAPPMEPDARRTRMLDHLAQAPEESLDATYLDQQVLAHEETATLMRNYARSGDNPQLVSFAEGTLPVVERNLAAAKDLRARI